MGNDQKITRFNPGQPVFFQGEFCREFFGLKQGRFAMVRLPDAGPDVPLAKRLAQATLLEIFDRPGQVFGELDALLNKPHEFSVFALDPSDAAPIPASEEALRGVLADRPQIGIRTCSSIARTFHETVDRFAHLVRCEEELYRLRDAAARAFLSATGEIGRLGSTASARLLSVLEFARGHEAFERATLIAGAGRPRIITSSIDNAVVPPPDLPDKEKEFSSGTVLCRQGLPGDRLYILTAGTVEVILEGDRRVRITRPGSLIGEVALLQNLDDPDKDVRRTTNVICTTPVKAVVVELGQFENFFGSYPQILTDLMFALVNRAGEAKKLESGVRDKIHDMLFRELKYFLDAHHGIAVRLNELRKANPSLERPFQFCAHQSRQIYDAFSAALKQIRRD